VYVYYWRCPTPLYRDSDFVLLPSAQALQLLVLRELPEAKALRPVSQGEIDDEKAKMKALNPAFIKGGGARDKHNNIFDFADTVDANGDSIVVKPKPNQDLRRTLEKVTSTPIKGIKGIRRALVTNEEGEWLTIKTKDGKELKASIGTMNFNDLKQLGLDLTKVEYQNKPSGIDWGSMLIGFLPLLLFGGFLFFILQ
jgi:hypothetical protein